MPGVKVRTIYHMITHYSFVQWYALVYTDLNYVQGSRPDWYIPSMLYSQDIPFWSRTLDVQMIFNKASKDLLKGVWT